MKLATVGRTRCVQRKWPTVRVACVFIKKINGRGPVDLLTRQLILSCVRDVHCSTRAAYCLDRQSFPNLIPILFFLVFIFILFFAGPFLTSGVCCRRLGSIVVDCTHGVRAQSFFLASGKCGHHGRCSSCVFRWYVLYGGEVREGMASTQGVDRVAPWLQHRHGHAVAAQGASDRRMGNRGLGAVRLSRLPFLSETEKTTARVDGAQEIIDGAEVRNAMDACAAARAAGKKVQ